MSTKRKQKHRTLHPGVALCSPYAQGAVDNTCGLYAALNAICLASAPVRSLSMTDARCVMSAGLAHLQRHGWLSSVLIHGMTVQRQRSVMLRMARAAEQTVGGIGVNLSPLLPGRSQLTTEMVLQRISERIATGAAIVACLEKTHWHFTVIAGLSERRIYLFDSDGLQWIERRAFGISAARSQARHCVPRSSLIAVDVIEKQA